ncbi:MAG: phosphoribosyltransferase [Armatimonadetes bacterium]|nr:phosphoribosyltransferase [Armatimonadota bacterium]
MFRDRIDAGEQLAGLLEEYKGRSTLVLGLPKGGVPVAAEVARFLDAELDVLVARKVGAPQQREFAIGAVSEHCAEVRDEEALKGLGLSEDDWERQKARTLAEMQSQIELFRGGRELPCLTDRTVIVVDDGLATGRTAQAAVRAVAGRGAQKLVFAAPVASVVGRKRIEREEGVDEVVTVSVPFVFYAVGQFYRRFRPVEADEVVDVLERFRNARC